MSSRDIATICATVLRLAGVGLLIWGPNKETWAIGVTLVMGADVTNFGKSFFPKKGGE